jgi:murein DD-endopeptidase MepM/ murein hydrolase activator NlpD
MKFKPAQDRKYRFLSFRSFLLFFFISLLCLFCILVIEANKFLSYKPPLKEADLGERTAGAPTETASLLSSSPIKQCLEFVSYVVKPGDTFLGILSKYGLSSKQAIDCHSSLADLGLFSLMPGDSLVLTRIKSGALVGFSLLHKLSDWYNVSLDSITGIKASKKPVVFSSQRCLAKGFLTTSLSESMNDMGLSDVCVSKFADIFAWDINFFVDPQKGDSYEIIFEKKFVEGRFAGYGDILAALYVNNGRMFTAIGMKDKNGNMRYYDPEGRSVEKRFLKAPLRYNHVSSRFSHHRKHPILGIVRPHLGVDYAAPSGTPVHASADGVVCFVGYNGGYGNQVRIRHGSAYETSYGHLRAFGRGIKTGKRVLQGDLIGFVGMTGLATGPHLDYRMTRNSKFVNPSSISLPSGKGVPQERMNEFHATRQECLTLFTMRLRGETGAYVIDIIGSPADSSSVALGGTIAGELES